MQNPNLQFNNINPKVNVYNFNIYNNRYSEANTNYNNNNKKKKPNKKVIISNILKNNNINN